MGIKKTKLLNDAPTKSDAFGTHKRIAELLHQEIVESDEGRSIALVGDWGSGKSTVVEILKVELDENQDIPTHVFIYDAWSHQGDSLRRAFLDDFITSLKESLSEDQRLSAIHRVWNRTETTTTTREPILRRHAKLMLLSLATVPLGMELFQLPSNDGNIPWAGLCLWNNIIALILISFPIFLASIFGMINSWIKLPSIRKLLFGDSYNDPNFSVLSFFFEKVQGDIERREIKSPVDSIGTFREVFSQIVNDVHSRRAELRIVIVIDNIDRIPAEEAREFWSTMQTFFSDGGGIRQPQSMKYWLIAPFSVEALSFIFGDGALGTATGKVGNLVAEEDEPDTSGKAAKPTEEASFADDAKVRAKAYIDKTFGLAFYVPPPILSNWRRYFLDCLKEAFVEHDASDLEAVRDVYDFGRTAIGFVTPRDIKLFVNSLVALYRQRGDEIPLTMMASYLLHREEIGGTDVPDNLISLRERRAIGRANWRAMMAALHFGVPLADGTQLLLHEPLVRALREGSNEDLRALESRPGFADVLRKAVVDALGRSQADEGTALAQLAEKLGALECAGKPDVAHIWGDIGGGLRSVQEWSGLQESPADGIAIIIQHTREADRLALCKEVGGSLSEAKPAEAEDAQENLNRFAINWTLAAKAVVEGSGPAEGFKIDVPHDAKCALEIVKQLAALDVEPSVLSAFEVSTPVADLSNMLSVNIGEGNAVSSPDRFVACVVESIQLQLQWPDIGHAVTERIKVPDLGETEVRSHLGLLLSASGYKAFPDALVIMENLSMEGHLSHLYHHHRSNSDVRAMILAVTLLSNPKMDHTNQIGESQQGDAALNQLAEAAEPDAESVSNVADVVRLSGVADALYQIGAANQKVARFLAAVIGSLSKSDYRFGIAPEVIMEHWAFIEKHADLISTEDFLRNQKDREGLLSFVATQSFDVARSGFYRAATKVATHQDNDYWAFLEDGISGVTSNDWQMAVTANDGPHIKLVELVKDLRKAERDIHLQVAAKDAGLALVRKIVGGEQPPSDALHERLSDLVGLLQNGPRTSFVRDIEYDLMGLTDTDELIRHIEIVGDEIKLEQEKDSGKIVQRIFSPLMTKPTEITIAWMKNITERKGKSFWSLPDHAKQELESRFHDALADGEQQNESIRACLLDLAGSLDINLHLQDSNVSDASTD